MKLQAIESQPLHYLSYPVFFLIEKQPGNRHKGWQRESNLQRSCQVNTARTGWMEYQPNGVSAAIGGMQGILQAGNATNLGSGSALHIRIIRVF